MRPVNVKSAMVLILILGLAQSVSFDYISLYGIKPDILLVLTIFTSFVFSRRDSIKCAVTAGIIKDACSGFVFGSYTVSFLIICIIINRWQSRFFKEKALTQIFLTFVSYIFMGVIAIFINAVAYKNPDFFYRSAGVLLKGALYTCAASPFVFFITSKILRIDFSHNS
jgi:rod shape-determining protein MreD